MSGIKGTKLTLESEYGVCSIHVPEENMSIDDVMDCLVDPILRTAGYAEESIHNYHESWCQKQSTECTCPPLKKHGGAGRLVDLNCPIHGSKQVEK